jgi:hypothetical protein
MRRVSEAARAVKKATPKMAEVPKPSVKARPASTAKRPVVKQRKNYGY